MRQVVPKRWQNGAQYMQYFTQYWISSTNRNGFATVILGLDSDRVGKVNNRFVDKRQRFGRETLSLAKVLTNWGSSLGLEVGQRRHFLGKA